MCARPASKVPPYRRHKLRGLGYCFIEGRQHYFGAYDDPASLEAYNRLIAEWLSSNKRLPHDAGGDLTLVELCEAFMVYAKDYYHRPDGAKTSELSSFKQVSDVVCGLYGRERVRDFGPLALRAVREEFVRGLPDRKAGGDARRPGWCRREVNKAVCRVRQIVKWGVGRQLVPETVLNALKCVEPLRRGHSAARETPPVKPVPPGHVEAIREHVSKPVWALVQLQLATGARPGELIGIRPVDVDTTGDVWVYRPARHKTAHHGYERSIYIGPRGKELIRPFLDGRAVNAPLFSPTEAESDRRERMHAERTTPLSCGNAPGRNRKRRPRVKPGEQYTTESYRRAITRACDAANVPHWHPHQLRHNAATTLRREFGIEVARVVLGHRSAAVTQIYAEIDQNRAMEAIQRIG